MKQPGNRLRESIGISQAKYADVIGFTQSSINRYENGQVCSNIDMSSLTSSMSLLIGVLIACWFTLYLCT